tara:strand:+ start:7350 stop:9074 length:1725 start_codon:yes stop_codon:yes gene_type:complete
MRKKPLLILQNYKKKIDKSEKIFFLGRWCIPYDQEKYVNLKYCNSYHWADKSKRQKDFRYLQKLYDRIVVALSKKLNTLHSLNLSKREWQLIIGHWVMIFITKSFDSYENLKFFCKNNKKLIVRTNFFKIDLEDIISRNYDYFSYNSLNDFRYNQYIYQNIILHNFKKTILINNVKLPSQQQKKYHDFTENNFLLQFVKKIINNLSFFQTNKTFFELSYINFLYKIKLISLLKNISYPPYINSYFKNKLDIKLRENNIKLKTLNNFEKFLNLNILKYLPKSYIEDFKDIYKNAKRFNTNYKKVFSTGSYISNDTFKIWLSQIIRKGGKFFIMYHGGGMPSENSIIHNHDNGVSNKVFVWHKPINGNQKQMPNLIFTKKKFKREKKIIIVTLQPNTSFYPIKTDDGPVSSLFLDDLNQKCNLAEFLIKDNQNIKIRAVNHLVWDFKERLINKFGKNILDKEKNFLNTLKQTKLHVSGYLSTTFSESINLNIPTIGLIEKKFYNHSNKFNKLLQDFEANNILFSNSKKLSNFLRKNDYDLDSWWGSNKINKIIDNYKKDVLGDRKEAFNNWKKIIL